MHRAILPHRPRGHDEDRADMSLGRGEQWNDDQEPLPWRGFAARIAPSLALALVLITACASAFSMLIWEPAADPPASVTSIVDSSQSEHVLPGKARRVRKFTGGREGTSLCSLIRVQKKGRLSERTSYHKWNRRPALFS